MADFRSQRELFDFGKSEYKDYKLTRALELLGEDYVKKMTEILLAKNKRATGELIRSLGWEILPEVDKLILNLYAASHLEYVQNGRRPNSKPPPYRVLLPWLRARGITFQNKSEKGTAIIIAKSIGKKGIKPVREIKQTLQKIYDNKANLIARAAREDIEDLINQYLVIGTLQ